MNSKDYPLLGFQPAFQIIRLDEARTLYVLEDQPGVADQIFGLDVYPSLHRHEIERLLIGDHAERGAPVAAGRTSLEGRAGRADHQRVAIARVSDDRADRLAIPAQRRQNSPAMIGDELILIGVVGNQGISPHALPSRPSTIAQRRPATKGLTARPQRRMSTIRS